ncbi:hypothetical protein P4J10_14210 [Bacillus cereus]|uniref:hypothetical protein n=1 Tax=Bacillus thuringiensis TaxID=1428 RepID=UPI000B42FD89|nr:hypothetical protein [Bacillus thuringiensis]MEB9467824.1 hypothetical protein [Bacillus cereus]OUA16706.1 hypothetical protein BK776_30665 [Bacillus thuringiensis serovar aizawai]
MKNKKLIKETVCKLEDNLKLGCYDEKLENLSKNDLSEILSSIEAYAWGDKEITINQAKHIVEIERVVDEVDLYVLTKEEYIRRYGMSLEDYEDKFGDAK